MIDTITSVSKILFNEGIEIPLTGGTSSEEQEYQPNADMVWARQVCENDVQDGFTGKFLIMLGDLSETTPLPILPKGAIKTSDGVYYTNDKSVVVTVTHTWDDTNARISESYQGRYNKVRWVISYSSDGILNSQNTISNKAIYVCFSNINCKQALGNSLPHNLVECIEFINNATLSGNTVKFSEAPVLKAIFFPNTSNLTSLFGAFTDNYNLKFISLSNTENITSLQNAFKLCYSLEKVVLPNTKKVGSFAYAFQGCVNLKNVEFDTTNSTENTYMFSGCSLLEKANILTRTDDTTYYCDYIFNECVSLKEVSIDTSNARSLTYAFYKCMTLENLQKLNLKNISSLNNTFSSCYNLRKIELENTENLLNITNMCYRCAYLEDVLGLNLINVTNASSAFGSCRSLKNLILKNIKISLALSDCPLSLDSLTNIIKELHDNTSGTSTKTLTVGTANLSKLANVYVKLIDITDEMRAEDEYIDNKKPFVVCESTDEGAMLISEYVTSKNWQLK